MSYLVLDTETTGKYPDTAECLSVAIIDHTGAVLLDTLVRPARATSWPEAQRIHGITPAQVLRPDVPTLAELSPSIANLLRGREVVIYNASYDATILAEAFALAEPVDVHCCMLAFSEHPEVRVWNEYHGNYRWQSLATAAAHVGHVWTGRAHGALADCYAARDVWAWLTIPEERAQLEAAKAKREEQERIDWYLNDVCAREAAVLKDAESARNIAWERRHYPAMGVREFREPMERSARESADVFMLHLEGTTAQAWNRWGEKLLKLPRYERVGDLAPANLTTGCPATGVDWHLLPAAQRLKPAGLLIYGPADSPPHEWLDAKPLYKKRALRKGVHYVPLSFGYEPWPEGHYSKTTLERQFKLRPAAIGAMKPSYLRVVKHGSRYENEYLLYAYTPISQPETPALVGTATDGE